MGYWATCRSCKAQIYMAEVIPPNETEPRWLPFDDAHLKQCHLDTCGGSPASLKCVIIKKKKVQFEEKENNTSTCPFCDIKPRKGIDQHVSVHHPEKWQIYFKKADVQARLGPLQRCDACGALVKNLERHMKKAHDIAPSKPSDLFQYPEIQAIAQLLIEKGIFTQKECCEKLKQIQMCGAGGSGQVNLLK